MKQWFCSQVVYTLIYHMPKPLIIDRIKWLYILTQKIANCLCQLLESRGRGVILLTQSAVCTT